MKCYPHLLYDALKGFLQFIVSGGQFPEVSVNFKNRDDNFVDLVYSLIQPSLQKKKTKERMDKYRKLFCCDPLELYNLCGTCVQLFSKQGKTKFSVTSEEA